MITYVLYHNIRKIKPTPSSPVYRINKGRDIFLQTMSPYFRVGLRRHMKRAYISTRSIDCFVHLYFVRSFGATSVELHRSLKYAAVRYSQFGSAIRFVQNLCNRTFTVLKAYFNRIGH